MEGEFIRCLDGIDREVPRDATAEARPAPRAHPRVDRVLAGRRGAGAARPAGGSDLGAIARDRGRGGRRVERLADGRGGRVKRLRPRGGYGTPLGEADLALENDGDGERGTGS